MREANIAPESPMALATDELDGVDDEEASFADAQLDEPAESAMLTGGDDLDSERSSG